MFRAMPKRDVAEFISHWKGATASEQPISQQFLCELCDLLDVPQPGNQRNGASTFEFHVSVARRSGRTIRPRPDRRRDGNLGNTHCHETREKGRRREIQGITV
jgi:hypothetical protein